MSRNNYKCWHGDQDEDQAVDVESWSHEFAADDAIKHWERNCDGWEWLDTGTEVFVSDGKEIQKFVIEKDYQTVYYTNRDYDYEPTTKEGA